MTARRKTTSSDPAKILYHRVVKRYMNPTVFGLGKGSGLHFPNTPENPSPRRVSLPKDRCICKPETLTRALVADHLQPGLGRIYLVNRSNTPTKAGSRSRHDHLLAIDIDGHDSLAARELAATIQGNLSGELPTPTLALPSTHGEGIHLWLVVRRHHRMAIPAFNKLMHRLTAALKQAYPRGAGDTAWVDAVKGLPWWDAPNPAFSTAAAAEPAWRNPRPEDPPEIVTGGYVRYTAGERYERSKGWPDFHHNPELEPTIRRYDTNALIAVPCAGRPDLVGSLANWLDEAEAAPATTTQLRKWANRQLGPESEADPKRVVTPPTPPAPVHPATNPLPYNPEANRSWQTLTTSQDKPDVSMAAAHIALQRHGLAATLEDTLGIYEAEAPTCTGERTRKRERRLAKALKLAKATYDPSFTQRGNAPLNPAIADQAEAPVFNDVDVAEIALWMEGQALDIAALGKTISGKNRRKAKLRHMALVLAIYRRYCEKNAHGQVNQASVTKSAAANGVSINGKAITTYRHELIRIGALVCVDSAYFPGVRAQCFAVGPNLPATAWMAAMGQWAAHSGVGHKSIRCTGLLPPACVPEPQEPPDDVWSRWAIAHEEEMEASKDWLGGAGAPAPEGWD
ncbi:MAG: hypothetical protein NTW19_17570, partial [Planctomycetota bacterium]|nr:hypothetical protein [Planctomycetota bacterium]